MLLLSCLLLLLCCCFCCCWWWCCFAVVFAVIEIAEVYFRDLPLCGGHVVDVVVGGGVALLLFLQSLKIRNYIVQGSTLLNVWHCCNVVGDSGGHVFVIVVVAAALLLLGCC